ncbi:MAG: helix-turn-helix transcriptional regulator [Clostridia bacterium]|nr:helix-turn-helix transcriptional regulator [Clostridia bacterium]
MKIAERIYELRKEAGLSQEQLAKEIGVTHRAVSFWEASINEPKASYIYQLAKFFNVSADYLLGLED